MPQWKICPREELEFICQTLVLFVVIIISLYNLTILSTEADSSGSKYMTLWAAIFGSALGLCTPGPYLVAGRRHLLPPPPAGI